MSLGKYLSFEEARQMGKLDRFAKESFFRGQRADNGRHPERDGAPRRGAWEESRAPVCMAAEARAKVIPGSIRPRYGRDAADVPLPVAPRWAAHYHLSPEERA